jgi:hypothetical protein
MTSLDRFASVLADMAARPDYHYPIVAAQRQFRERYYGLSSAAMLEDLFFDTVGHFISSHHPGLTLSRPRRGEKGWDYELDGLRVSHKVAKAGAPDIAALWDATKTDMTTYTYPSPITLTIGGYKPASVRVEAGSEHWGSAKPIDSETDVHRGDTLMLVQWGTDTHGRLLHAWSSQGEGRVYDVFPFRPIWAEIARASAAGIAANHVELLLVADGDAPVVGAELTLTNACRPGTYLIPQDALVDVPVKTNNKAVLMPRSFINKQMDLAVTSHHFVPMPTWFAAYAGDRPPDLYLAQKRNYDGFFTAGAV